MVRGGKAEEGSSTCSLSKDSGGGARTKRGEGGEKRNVWRGKRPRKNTGEGRRLAKRKQNKPPNPDGGGLPGTHTRVLRGVDGGLRGRGAGERPGATAAGKGGRDPKAEEK